MCKNCRSNAEAAEHAEGFLYQHQKILGVLGVLGV
jgi:hypothetical protein